MPRTKKSLVQVVDDADLKASTPIVEKRTVTRSKKVIQEPVPVSESTSESESEEQEKPESESEQEEEEEQDIESPKHSSPVRNDTGGTGNLSGSDKRRDYIDEVKYDKLSSTELSTFSNDDLASVLFVRFKKEGSILMRLALDIHRTILDPSRKLNQFNRNSVRDGHSDSGERRISSGGYRGGNIQRGGNIHRGGRGGYQSNRGGNIQQGGRGGYQSNRGDNIQREVREVREVRQVNKYRNERIDNSFTESPEDNNLQEMRPGTGYRGGRGGSNRFPNGLGPDARFPNGLRKTGAIDDSIGEQQVETLTSFTRKPKFVRTEVREEAPVEPIKLKPRGRVFRGEGETNDSSR